MIKLNYKVSILVPVYNVEKYIDRCLQSLIGQTYRNIEIILVDDGSTDHSGDICDSYARKDSRLKVIHKENGGVVSARKTGAEYVTGDYVCSVDSDDWIEANRILNFVEQGAYTKADMIYLEGYYKDYDNRSVLTETSISEGLYLGKQVIEQVFPMIIDTKICFQRMIRAMTWCWGIKKELFQKMWKKIDDRISMGDDYAHILCCLLEAQSVFLMRERGYHYVERMNSISHSLNENALHGVRIWTQMVRDQMRLSGCDGQLYLHMVFLELWYIMNCDYSLLLKKQRKYLYPYPIVRKGSKIAVYGGGTLGTQIVNALDYTKDYQVVIWVDKYSTYQPLPGHKVEDISKLADALFDFVVIAVLDIKIVEEIEQSLLKNGIPEYKIAKMDANVIGDEDFWEDFEM